MIGLLEKYAIEKSCAKGDCYDRSLTEVYFDAEKKRMVATNGHILAAVPVVCTEDEKSRYLSAVEVASLRLPSVNEHDGILFPTEAFDKHVSSIDNSVTVAVGFDLGLLKKLCESIGNTTGCVIFHFTETGITAAIQGGHCYIDPIKVTRENGSVEFGILMPRRV